MSKDKSAYIIQTVLAVSLLANGYAFGVLSQDAGDGLMQKSPHTRPAGPPNPMRSLYRAADNLQPEKREKIKAILQEHDLDHDQAATDGPRLFRKLRKVVSSSDSTLEDLDKVLAKITDHHQTIGTGMHAAMRAIFVELDGQKERAIFFKHALPNRPGHGPRHEPDDRHNRGGDRDHHAPGKHKKNADALEMNKIMN